ncbi:hypothetical protein AMIS_29800 [Actinoplanes missouriensis 431]|uniref:Uncharacterized protein n=1 Tax=Actinoplanes missouriensis (strain ATCC 14538 / DSM 43046 / CBS 188.64 / JCM 3121 / NBRC 102363 / NCIMB 12654 / NRRL B-3342 / UNCC 431) TaxID=512565 RepID=I0H5B3_ACTM4|nr:hypothetical protein [Actinoplanes missouriensis]BAL88200.1 hypothetical protein AMIS_29800 [Actinoplanes missouriensis 431]
MTQLDDLKDAMHSPPDFQPAALDLQQVMAAGGRMRRRRRLAVGGASALTVAALLIGGSQLVNAGGPNGSLPADGPSGMVSGPSMPLPSAGNSSAPGVLGTVVKTGRKADGREWIIYVETVDPDKLDETMTLVLGRTRTGTIDDFRIEIVSSDPGAGRMAPGFHAVQAGRLLNGRTTPTFGYYVGKPSKITARDAATGKTVVAKRTAWNGFGPPEKAQIFWFDFAEGQPPATLTDLTAYDAGGATLHTGG